MANKAAALARLSDSAPMIYPSCGVVHRRDTEKGIATAAAILEQAKTILSEDGLAAVSIRNIALRCRISPGNVTYHFKTKDILFAELAKYLFARWSRRFHQDIAVSTTSKLDKLIAMVEYMIEENKRPKTNMMLLDMWAMANHSPAVMTMMDVFYAEMRCSIETLLEGINPRQSCQTRRLRAALITVQIEGLMILIGPNRPDHFELRGLEAAAVAQIKHLALSDATAD